LASSAPPACAIRRPIVIAASAAKFRRTTRSTALEPLQCLALITVQQVHHAILDVFLDITKFLFLVATEIQLLFDVWRKYFS
jgi:hypothetical protein